MPVNCRDKKHDGLFLDRNVCVNYNICSRITRHIDIFLTIGSNSFYVYLYALYSELMHYGISLPDAPSNKTHLIQTLSSIIPIGQLSNRTISHGYTGFREIYRWVEFPRENLYNNNSRDWGTFRLYSCPLCNAGAFQCNMSHYCLTHLP